MIHGIYYNESKLGSIIFICPKCKEEEIAPYVSLKDTIKTLQEILGDKK